MYIFKVHGKEYKVRFTYRTLTEGDVLDKVVSFGDFNGKSMKDIMVEFTRTVSELLLAGLQKYHSDEFGYDNDEEKEIRINEMLDILDDYEDESTKKHPQNASTLFADMNEELRNNGFLSVMLQTMEEVEEMEQTAETTKTEMENESARVIAMNTPLSENES